MVAEGKSVVNLAIPPFGTDIFSKNAQEKLVNAPNRAAKIAFQAVKEYFGNNPYSSIKKIVFASRQCVEDDKYQVAYKMAFGIPLGLNEQAKMVGYSFMERFRRYLSRDGMMQFQTAALAIVGYLLLKGLYQRLRG